MHATTVNRTSVTGVISSSLWLFLMLLVLLILYVCLQYIQMHVQLYDTESNVRHSHVRCNALSQQVIRVFKCYCVYESLCMYENVHVKIL